LLQEFLQSKKIPLPTYNVVATHGAAHSQEFEIECLVPKLGIQVFGRGGSRRAGEQAAARLALEVAEQAAQKAPSGGRKAKPRAAQLKLAGIATDQSADQSAEESQSKQTQQQQAQPHAGSKSA
jgi:ribonuclease-3